MFKDDHYAPDDRPKVGVYVCHCGINIAAKVDVAQVVAFAATLPLVTVAREYKFMCSDPGQELIQNDFRSALCERGAVCRLPGLHRCLRVQEGKDPGCIHRSFVRLEGYWLMSDYSPKIVAFFCNEMTAALRRLGPCKIRSPAPAAKERTVSLLAAI
jgi:hypothetical protein